MCTDELFKHNVKLFVVFVYYFSPASFELHNFAKISRKKTKLVIIIKAIVMLIKSTPPLTTIQLIIVILHVHSYAKCILGLSPHVVGAACVLFETLQNPFLSSAKLYHSHPPFLHLPTVKC